jgi:cell division protein FtsB
MGPGSRFSWKRLVPLLLVLLLALLQFQLWFGIGNVPSAMRLKSQVEAQNAENATLAKRNAALAAEVSDLKGGQAAIEERARVELGMVKKGESFYQIVQAPAPATH